MNIFRRMLEYFERIFSKKQLKMLEEPSKRDTYLENKGKESFRQQLKVKNNKTIEVETEICEQNGLGFEGKIKA